MFGPTETTTGGNALKFYASVRVEIRPGTSVKDGEDVIGRHSKVKIVKNKVAPPFKRCEFDIMFGEGVSRSYEIIDLGVEMGVIKKSGSWFSYEDSKLAQGRDAVKRMLDDNPELTDELEAKIMEALQQREAAARQPKGKKTVTVASMTRPEPKEEEDDLDTDDLDELPLDFSIDEDA